MSIKVMTKIWESSKAKGSTLLLMLAIGDHAHDDGAGAYPSVETLARKTRMSARNVQNLIKEAVALGELRVEYNTGLHGANNYTIDLDVLDRGEKIAPVKYSARKGEVQRQEPVKPSSPKPSLEPSTTGGAKNAPAQLPEKEPLADEADSHCLLHTEVPLEWLENDPRGRLCRCPKCDADAEYNAIPSASSAPVHPSPQQAMIGALATVCGIDLSLCNGKYAKAAQRLVKAGYTADQITELYGEGGEWYRYDWRGRDKHDPPNIGSINETIQRAVSGAWKQNIPASGKGAPTWIDNLKAGFAMYDEATNGGN